MKRSTRFIVAIVLGTVAASGALASTSDAGSKSSRSGEVYFYSDVANSVPGPSFFKNTPSVRPSYVLTVENGSWVVEKLHWSSWGRRIARATGISSASNCTPDCAHGKRTNHRVRFVLSKPKILHGRTVYTCFQLTAPTAPDIDQHSCLKHSRGKQYVYTPVPGSPLHLSEFLSPQRKIWCLFSDIPGVRYASCNYGGPPNQNTALEYSATLHPSGGLTTCSWTSAQDPNLACFQNWDTTAPVLKAGQVDVIDQYRCKATATAIACTVDVGPGKGKGFEIDPTGVTQAP